MGQQEQDVGKRWRDEVEDKIRKRDRREGEKAERDRRKREGDRAIQMALMVSDNSVGRRAHPADDGVLWWR